MTAKSLVALLALLVSLSSAVSAHIEKTEPLQSLRQSYFALLGMTFAPMGDMVKGKIEWDATRFSAWADDLHHASQSRR